MMLAVTLLVLVGASDPPPDYRRAELTEADRRNVAIMCESTNWTKATRLDCVKQETEKLRKQKKDQVDAREAEARTARQTAR